MRSLQFLALSVCFIGFVACDDRDNDDREATSGLKIAYVNGDSILNNYAEFRAASESMEAKQRSAEGQLQAKGAELESEIMAYQRKVQSGTLSRNEMEAQERRLGAKQEALLRERDEISDALLTETAEINERLQKVIKGKLEEIKKAEGYDFIFSYVQGGSILIADESHDITDRVLEMINSTSSEKVDTSKAQ